MNSSWTGVIFPEKTFLGYFIIIMIKSWQCHQNSSQLQYMVELKLNKVQHACFTKQEKLSEGVIIWAF